MLYSKTTVPSIYKDFKEAISICFNMNQHPAAQFDKLAAAFAHLGSVTIGTGANLVNLKVQDQFQALIALAALPSKWEMQSSHNLSGNQQQPRQCGTRGSG